MKKRATAAAKEILCVMSIYHEGKMINKVEKFDYKTAEALSREKKTANIHKINYEQKSIPNFVYFYKNDFTHTHIHARIFLQSHTFINSNAT